MSRQPVIDGFEFASAGASQQGVLPLSAFPRLGDALASSAGEVAYSVKGMRDERGRAGLRVKVQGTLPLRCQRCLEPIAFGVDSDSTLVLAATQAEIDAEPADPSAPDRVLAGKEMALRDLVEDELILAMPYAPRHDNCAGRASVVDADARLSPFSSLRGLMRSRH
ncbi:MAG TPA: YceD family protein [Burkholderiales bacterium]|nr:YceD family protein [Burkholderiales bacterium]